MSAFKHGLSGYTNHRCRCDVCATAHREYKREYRRSDKHREYQREYMREYGQSASGRTSRERGNRKKRTRLGDRRGRYTPAEDRIVAQTHLTVIERAAQLGRTAESVNNRANLLRRKGLIP